MRINGSDAIDSDTPHEGTVDAPAAPGVPGADARSEPRPSGSLSSEILLTRATLVFTLVASALFLFDLGNALAPSLSPRQLVEATSFISIVGFLIYGNVAYQITRIASLQRIQSHRPDGRDALESVYLADAPPIAFLVPCYKEETRIVRQTLLSAALQEPPLRRVVLLIDDPSRFDDPGALAALVAVRQLATELHDLLAMAATRFIAARDSFVTREANGSLQPAGELGTLAGLYVEAACWLERQAQQVPLTDHTDRFFVEAILRAPARAHRERAAELRMAAGRADPFFSTLRLRREHERLASLFRVELTSFERKRYANLSPAPNKAMNLNAYISLLGRSYREVVRGEEIDLEPVVPEQATLHIPDVKYLITLDADSLLLPDYALRLLHLLESPGGERVAVAQTPYSAVPNAAGMIERIAGATTDIQYLIHQGFTLHRATFWVGANAILRRAALEDIATVEDEKGRAVKRYIQDRTVIEDTESTVDLVNKGWRLFNYPERLAYSATPSDFGALVVQRARWANGGLIILPKLLRYLAMGPDKLRKFGEGFFRVHYLTSITGVNVGLLLILAYPFGDTYQNVWLPLTAAPYYALYARDLWRAGYRNWADVLRVYALNLLLLPVNLGGVLRSMHQAVRGHRIPFRRTPKIAGRTRIPARYVVCEFAIMTFCLVAGIIDVFEHRWAHAFFGALNGVLYLYAIHKFIGFAESWDDLRSGVEQQMGVMPSTSL